MSALNLWGTSLELAGTLLLAGELLVFMRRGPSGPEGGRTAAALRQYYAERENRVHRMLAYLGIVAVVVGLALQVASEATGESVV